jgi:hypothetical protein
MRGRPKLFGETPLEREIIREIIFRRIVKRQSFQSTANDLNSQSKWPRRASRWTAMLVFHVWKNNHRRENKEKVE